MLECQHEVVQLNPLSAFVELLRTINQLIITCHMKYAPFTLLLSYHFWLGLRFLALKSSLFYKLQIQLLCRQHRDKKNSITAISMI